MDALTALVTGSGAPGIVGTIHSLRNNFDNRDIRVVGTDIKSDVIGSYLCESFYSIPKPSEEAYLERLLSICKKEKVDVLLPQNTLELPILANNKHLFLENGTSVTISDAPAITVANDKHELLKLAEKTGIPIPNYVLVENFDSLIESASGMGWPDKPIVIKPPISNGMRGVRIIDESIDLKKMFFSEKPSSLYIKMRNLHEVLGNRFPPLLVMEYLPGVEYTVDILKGKDYTIIPRKRDVVKSGITFNGTVEHHEGLIDYARKLSDVVGLDYAFGFQFKLDENETPKLLECNPRVQGTMVLSTFAGANIIYAAVKQALGEDVPNFDIEWGTRIMRYWGGMGIHNGKPMVSL